MSNLTLHTPAVRHIVRRLKCIFLGGKITRSPCDTAFAFPACVIPCLRRETLSEKWIHFSLFVFSFFFCQNTVTSPYHERASHSWKSMSDPLQEMKCVTALACNSSCLAVWRREGDWTRTKLPPEPLTTILLPLGMQIIHPDNKLWLDNGEFVALAIIR